MKPSLDPETGAWLYEWPTHLALPDVHPGWGKDPVEFRRARGEWVPPLITEFTQTSQVTVAEARALRQLCCFLGVGRSEWNRVKKSLLQDPTRIDGFCVNLTLAWQRERDASYVGTDEARAGSIWSIRSVAGAGKSMFMLWLMWRDHLSKRRTGFLRRLGMTPSDKFWKFGPWNFIADVIAWDRGRAGFPRGATLGLDDPRYREDAENRDLFEIGKHNLLDSVSKQRDPGITLYESEVEGRLIEDAFFTDLGWIYRGFRVPDFFGHAVRQERGEDGRYSATGFLLPVHPRLDVTGPCAAMDGPALMEEIRRIKQEAHAGLFGGRDKSYRRDDLVDVLRESPVEAVRNCFTIHRRKHFLSPILSERWGYTAPAVEVSEEMWKSAIGYFGSVGKDKEVAGGGRFVLKDSLDRPIAVSGEDLAEKDAKDIVEEWCDYLNKPRVRKALRVLEKAVA